MSDLTIDHVKAPFTTRPLFSSSIEPRHFGLERGAEPVRKIRPRTGRLTMPGWFPTDKGTLPSLRVESLFELSGLGHFEVNPDIILMATQPHKLVYDEPTSDGLTIKRSYTPDVALQMADGHIVVIDFKPAIFARSDKWTRKAAVLQAAYERDHGVTFNTITEESTLIEPRRTNVSIMLMHRKAVPDVEAETQVMAAIDAVGLPSTIGAIKARTKLPAGPHVDRAFSTILRFAIAGVFKLNLGIPLGPDTIVAERRSQTEAAR